MMSENSAELTNEDDGAEDAAPENQTTTANMGREVKVGLSVIGTLMMVLAGIVYVKMGMPGIRSKGTVVAAAADGTPAEGAQPDGAQPDGGAADAPPAQELAEPVQVPMSDTAGAVDPFSPGADRYAQPMAAPVEEPIEPDAQAMPPASATATPFGDTRAVPAALVGAAAEGALTDGNVQPVAATQTEPAPLADHELPLEPNDDGSLVPAGEPQLAPATEPQLNRSAEPQLNSPADSVAQQPDAQHAVGPQGLGEPAGVNQTAHEPPHDAPYGSRYTDDRYPAQHPGAADSHAPGANVAAHNAPAAHGAAPHAAVADHAPAHPAAAHAAPAATAHAASATPPPRHDMPYEHADLAHRPSRDGSYIVEPNDSFWTISQKVYGAPGFFKALQRHNRKPGTPNVGLSVGEKISTPPAETLRRDYPNLCPKQRATPASNGGAFQASSHRAPNTGHTYVVQEGDTLFDIARYELGKASRWSEVYELNRDQLGEDYNHLAPGMRLALPADAAMESDAITSRPATPYK